MNNIVFSLSQLGYMPKSPKTITIRNKENNGITLPDEIPFYIQNLGSRLKRKQKKHPLWTDTYFRWPYNISEGHIENDEANYMSFSETPCYKGHLKKVESRWGTFWQAEFTSFEDEGIYQIETEFGFSTPFAIQTKIYDRLGYGFLHFLYAQRSGMDIPGIRDAEFADDAMLDISGQHLPVAGGWNDAGDYRKWLCFTLFNLGALSEMHQYEQPVYHNRIIDEIRWGNLCFHAMINADGQVYEDVGGGEEREGTDYEKDWWTENHPGVTAGGSTLTDNISCSGDERKVRSNYNPWVQFAFIRMQIEASSVLSKAEKSNCIVLAKRAWDYSQKNKHDERTLFIGAELNAAISLYSCRPDFVEISRIRQLLNLLFERQETRNADISGYFYEKDKKDGFRSFAFSADPAFALLNTLKANIAELSDLKEELSDRLKGYINKFLIADSFSNPFNVTPYGTFVKPKHRENQTFREAGNDVYIRTFLHPLNDIQVPHGTNSVLMQHAHLLAKAGLFFNNNTWINHAEKLLQWSLGHNIDGLCLFTDLGFRHPIPLSFVNLKIPYAPVAGYIGWFDDSPYMETSNGVEWSTQEIWNVPFYNAIKAVIAIKRFYALR